MKKNRLFTLLITLVLLISAFFTSGITAYADGVKVYLGGMPAGFSMSTRGANVLGLCDVITDDGIKSPSRDSNLQIGDIILSIDGIEVNSAQDIAKVLNNSDLKILKVNREDNIFLTEIIPAKDITGNYKLGVYIKDNINGIGTVTFIKGNRIAALGHPVLNDDGSILDITSGDVYSCEITGYVRGERGKPGELRGIFNRNDVIATIEKNLENGLYGKLTQNAKIKNLQAIETGSAKVGKATIKTTISDDNAIEYEISIIKVDLSNDTKNFVLKITDERLLSTTGGIVQGMSGSPIIQDGKLVGAVTHVFINDPTRGFGISIDKMINN